MNDLDSAEIDSHPIADGSNFLESVPTIDIGKYMLEDDDQVIAEIAKAGREGGFFQVVDHGISKALIAEVLELTKQFFTLPIENKSRVMRNRDNPWGYYNNELTKNKRDKKEIFDYTAPGVDPIYNASNQWPDFNPRFEHAMYEYMAECNRVSLRLVDAFAAGLGLDSKVLGGLFIPKNTGFMRLNHYPVVDPLKGQLEECDLPEADLGIHHHTDAGAVTLLLQDEVSGLQLHKDGMWHNILPVDGALVVNTGDMMQVLSNDTYQAPLHRVLAMKNADRFSIPFFLNPSAQAVIESGAVAVSGKHKALYSPISWSDFRKKRSDGDYSNYGTEVQISHYRI